MRVRVDPTKCEAFKKCNEAAPELFKLDDFGYADMDEFVDVPAALIAKVREAANLCPTGAVMVEE